MGETAPTLSSSSLDTLERTIDVGDTEAKSKAFPFATNFEIDHTVEIIRQRKASRVALQFPDELLNDSSHVYKALYEGLGDSSARLFILGDTSYGSCCIDEVAAEHVASDLIVHYGNACLTPPSRIPALYVFTRLNPFDVSLFCSGFDRLFKHTTNSTSVLVYYDVRYHYMIPELNSKIRELGYQDDMVEIPSVPDSYEPTATTRCTHCQIGQSDTTNCHSAQSREILCQCDTTNFDRSKAEAQKEEMRSIFGRQLQGEYKDRVPQDIVYIGAEQSRLLVNLLLQYRGCRVWRYNPTTNSFEREENDSIKRILTKRYYLVEKAKDSVTYGIVAGTLGVGKYLEIIERLKKLILRARKKYYLFIVGKLNPVKLANFEHIDMYVLVACPENSMIDSREFYKPVITPFELEIALRNDKEWTGEYQIDFQTLLHTELPAQGSDEEEEQPRVSLVDGEIKMPRGQTLEKPSVKSEDDGLAISVANVERSIVSTMDSPALDYLSKRAWKGLALNLGETPVELASPGREGLPKGYTHEPAG